MTEPYTVPYRQTVHLGQYLSDSTGTKARTVLALQPPVLPHALKAKVKAKVKAKGRPHLKSLHLGAGFLLK